MSSAGCALTSEVKDISNVHVFFSCVSFNSTYNLVDISDVLLLVKTTTFLVLVQFIWCLFKQIQVIWLLCQMIVDIAHFMFRFSIYPKLFLYISYWFGQVTFTFTFKSFSRRFYPERLTNWCIHRLKLWFDIGISLLAKCHWKDVEKKTMPEICIFG
jgi:hypothetical protein